MESEYPDYFVNIPKPRETKPVPDITVIPVPEEKTPTLDIVRVNKSVKSNIAKPIKTVSFPTRFDPDENFIDIPN